MEQFKTVKAELEAWGSEAVADVSKSLPPESDASGRLRQSIHFTIRYFGSVYTFEFKMEDYWKWVNDGRPPGKMPPIFKLISWASEKKLAIRNDTKRLGTKRNTIKDVALSEKAKKSLAFAVGRKIAREGTEGNYFYTKVMTPERINDLSRRLTVALKRDVEVYIQENI